MKRIFDKIQEFSGPLLAFSTFTAALYVLTFLDLASWA
jgi:hypothetical protein